MELEYVPLLRTQRELYDLPRGGERFREYLRRMIDARTGDLRLPLVALNPMGKPHVAECLDALLALDADGEGARTLAAVAPRLAAEPGTYRVCLVLADDRGGGWTDRAASEFTHRFETRALDTRGWLTGQLWTSEAPSREDVRVEVAAVLWRAAWLGRHGAPRTLGEMLEQEGAVMKAAGRAQTLDIAALERTATVLTPLLEREDRPTVIAALFGDEAALRLGYPALGLVRDAGLAWALAKASTTSS